MFLGLFDRIDLLQFGFECGHLVGCDDFVHVGEDGVGVTFL